MKKNNPSQRMCVGCRQMKEKTELVRIVRLPEGGFCLDRSGKTNGRGAYLCQNPGCLQKARKNHGFQRSFKGAVPDEVLKLLEDEIIGGR